MKYFAADFLNYQVLASLFISLQRNLNLKSLSDWPALSNSSHGIEINQQWYSKAILSLRKIDFYVTFQEHSYFIKLSTSGVLFLT